MPVCNKRKIAFCHVPRTGGRSVIIALDLIGKDKHEPASWYREIFPDYHLFATIRLYRDRLKSAFNYQVPKSLNFKGTFKEYVDLREKDKNKALMIYPNDYFLDCDVDTLLNFDNLEADLNKMLKKLKLKTVKLKYTNDPERINKTIENKINNLK